MDNNDFILKIVAELEQKGIKTGFDKLKKELEKDPAKIDVILDTSGTVGKTKGSIKKLAAELHNELSVEINKLQKQGQDINFDLSVGDVEEVIQNVINHTKKLGESFDVASDKAQKFLAKFNKKSGGVLINSDEFKAVQEAINGLGNTHTIEDLNKAMSTLEVTYDNMSSKLRNSGKSLNPFINAKNEMATMDKTIEGISLEFEKLASKPEDVSNAIKELSVQQDKVNSYAVGTMEWADAYGHLQEMIRNVTKDISNLQKAQSAKSLQPQIDKIQLSLDTGDTESKVDALIAKTNQWTDANGNARISTQSLSAAFDNLTLVANEYLKIPTEANQRKLIEANEKLSIEYKKVTSDIRSMNAELAKDSAVDSLRQKYQNFYNDNGKSHKQFGDQLKSAMVELTHGAEIPKQRLEELKQKLIDISNTCAATGKTGQTWLQNLGDKIKSLTTYLSGAMIISKVLSAVKGGVSDVRELDTALVDLNKTTSMTNSELEEFYYTSNDVAKQMGVTTKEILDQASAWSRLGFSSAEAATKMAQYSSKFASISPGMGVDEAQEGLVSIIKAWDLDVDQVEREVLDNINTLGNKFAESNADLVQGMKRSAAALAATGTSYQEAFALFTGAQEVLQNAEVGGRALRSISMRIHGYSEESEDGLEVVDEELKNITGDLIDLTKTAKHSQGVSIFKEGSSTEFKSLVEYFGEINDIWSEMSQVQQNAFLDKAFGKNQAQAGAAIIQNYEAIAEAMEAMEGAAGSAEREMSVIMDSLDYKLNTTAETATGIAQNLFKKDDMKSVVDVLNSFMGVLDKVTEKLGLFNTTALGFGGVAGAKGLG